MIETYPPPLLDTEQRIVMTTRCRDADSIPKVADAGSVYMDADGNRVQVMHNGLKVLADGYYGSWMTRLITLCRGHHEPQEERVFHEVNSRLGPSARMVELGGFWAYYTLWFLRFHPQRQALVLEPDPAHLAVGRKNAMLNKLNPKFIAGFVGAKAAPPSPFKTEESGEVMLPCWSVQQLLDEHELASIDVLHCDTQGAEVGVLESCLPLFRDNRINWVFMSTHAFQISGDPLTHQRCLDLLQRAGAVIEVEHDVHESFSGDGLIVARLGDAPVGWCPPEISYNRYSQSLFRNPIYDLAERSARDEDVVRQIYETILSRQADEAGLKHFVNVLRHSGNIRAVLEGVLYSGEFAASYGNFLNEHVLARQSRSMLTVCGLNVILGQAGVLGEAGDRLVVPVDRVMLPEVMERASWDIAGLEFVAELLNKFARPFIFLDIGANIGLFTRQILRSVASAVACLCVEPDPQNFAALRYNLGDFGPHRVKLFNLALGLSEGSAVFYRDRENFGNYSLNIDAMRNRPFEQISVSVANTERWMRETLPLLGEIVWKSDTQGYDEAIIARTPWDVWSRVRLAKIELWRIQKPTFEVDQFWARIDAFPNKSLGRRPVTTDEVMQYLMGTDWEHADLYVWR